MDKRLLMAVSFCWAVLWHGGPVWAQTPGLVPRAYVLRGCAVVPRPGQLVPDMTIVVRDGKIEAIGKDVAVPPGAVEIACKGLYAYAGFMDAASFWGVDLALRRSEGGAPEPVDLAAEALAATKPDNCKGVTPEFEVATALTSDEERAEAWRRQGICLRLAAPEGGIFAGQSALVAMSGAVPRRAVLRSPAALHVSFRVAGPGYPATLMGMVAHFRQTLLDAQHYAAVLEHHRKNPVQLRPPLDPALAALLPALRRELPVVFEVDNRDSIYRALDLCEEFDLRPILFGAEEAWRVADLLQARGVPVIARINYPDIQQMSERGRRRGIPVPPDQPSRRFARPTEARPADPTPPEGGELDTPADLPERVRQDRERRRNEHIRNLAVLLQKGVRCAVSGADLDRPEKFLGNLRLALHQGLSAEQALAALTVHPASLWASGVWSGELASGQPAHVVLFTAPWQEANARVRYLIADGVLFDYESPATAQQSPQATSQPPGTRSPDQPQGAKKAVPPEAAKQKEKTHETAVVPVELDEDRRPQRRTGGNVLLRGATIVSVTNGSFKGDLLVRQGKIAHIASSIAPPAGVTVIPLEGYFVMPGIIDTHSHFAIAGGVNEFTLSIVPEVRVRDVIHSEDVQIYRALAGGVTTVRLLHGSANVIGGQDAVIKLKYGEPAKNLLVADAPRGVKFALGENVKRTDGRFPNTRLGVEAVLVRAFVEAQAYRRAWQAYEAARKQGRDVLAPRRDLRLEALADVLDQQLHIHCHCYRADEILMLLQVAERFGIRVRSLQHVLEGYKIAPEIARHGASCSPFSDWWAYKIEAYDAIPYNVALLQEAGVSVCLKSDSNELVRHMYQEAAKMLKYGGLDETEALKTITLNGAKQLGLDHRLGSIEPGKDADLAVFDGHPLNAYARCVMTLVDGEIYFDRLDRSPPRPVAASMPAQPRHKGVPVLAIARNPKRLYAIKNAHIHPVSAPDIPRGTLVIERGIVRAMGKEVPIPEGATVVDARGLHVYPGMIDAGTVIGLTELGSARETQDFAELGDFQPDLRAAAGINPDSELIPVTRANGVLAVVTRPTGGTVAGQSALIHLHGWIPTDMVVVDPLALHVEFPSVAPIVTGDPTLPAVGRAIARRQRDARIKKLRELFRLAQAYAMARQKAPLDLPLDPRLEALLPYARAEKPVIVQANRRQDILEALKLADELGWRMILSGGLDAWKVVAELKKRKVPVILGPVMILPVENWDPYDAPFTCAAHLYEAGVPFCIRSAGGSNTRNLPYEAAMAVSYGLPPEEGLKAVTLYPAQILGVADRLGSLEPGKIANFFLCDGDPLQAYTQVYALFIKGEPLEPTSKHTRLFERYRQRLEEVKKQ